MTDTMQVAESTGESLASLRLVTRPVPPPPGPGEVALEMIALSINPADVLQLQGLYGVKPKGTFVPGTEGLGRVTALGDGVTGMAVGDLAVPMQMGCWSERLVVPARGVIPLPAGVDLDQATMLKVNPATALAMLTDLVALAPGDWVVQNAANSAVGQNAVKIGRALGLRVACIVRREAAADALRRIGADVVLVDDGSDRPPRLPDGARARLALDAVGGVATERLAACVADGGTVVNYGLLSGQSPRLSAYDLVFRGLTLRGFWLASWFTQAPPERVRAAYAQLAGWLVEGRIGASVVARYPFHRLSEAVAHAARENRRGKVLMLTAHHPDAGE